MNIQLTISDDDYRRVLATRNRIRGTICQVSPKEFSFRAYSPRVDGDNIPCRRFRTSHIVTSITPKRIRLTFSLNRKEAGDPTEIIYDEIDDAADFVEDNLKK